MITSQIVLIYCVLWCIDLILMTDNQIIGLVVSPNASQINHLFSVKHNIHLFNVSSNCIVMHQRQYINMSTHCNLAALSLL